MQTAFDSGINMFDVSSLQKNIHLVNDSHVTRTLKPTPLER